MVDLHKRVRDARRAMRLTQAEVAKRAGISLGTYQTFETGRSMPQAGNLQAILDVFGDRFSADAADAAIAESTREAWPGDVRVFLDVMGAFLMTMSDDERLAFIHDETRRIIGSRSVLPFGRETTEPHVTMRA